MAELDARRAEVLSSAAKAIQQRIRTHYARKQFVALRKASICMQSLCRGELFKYCEALCATHRSSNDFIVIKWSTCTSFSGKLACKHYEGMKREAAAVKIQKNTRRREARMAYNKLRISVLVLQTGLRSMDACKRFTFKRQSRAATVIQVTLIIP